MPKMKLIALALLVAASLLVVAVQAQTTTTTEEAATTDASIEWKMFSGNIAGYGGAVETRWKPLPKIVEQPVIWGCLSEQNYCPGRTAI